MANYTANYDLVKPTMAETVDIRTINGNMDSIDNILHSSQVSLAPAYDANSTYNTGDVVMYELLMYECLDDDVTGVWDATKWQRTTAGQHGGGGGGSNVEITPTLQSGTKIADFEIDGVSGALYAPSGGGGGGGSKIVDTLWEGSATVPTTGTNFTLSHKYTDYDAIVILVGASNVNYKESAVFITDSLEINQKYVLTGFWKENVVAVIAYFDFVSDTVINLCSVASATPTTYYKIQGIKFGGGGGGSDSHDYDNTEKVVGTYFGKPLYEKSYQNIAGTGTSVNVTLSDLSNIETIFIVPEASASTDVIPFPYIHPSSVNIIGGSFSINNGVPTLSIRRGGDMASVGLKYLTVRYTKTTD